MIKSDSSLSIVVPVYCPNQYLLDITEHQFLNSLSRNSDRERTEIIVVDDASPKSSDLEKLLKKFRLKHGLNITILRNDVNMGFPYNVNLGMSAARHDYVAMSNNDIYIPRGTIDSMLSVLDTHPNIAAVGPAVNRTINKGYKGQVVISFNTTSFDEREFKKIEDIAITQRALPRTIFDVDWLVGYFMMLRKSAFKDVGGMDVKYGLGYGEEVDLCFRLKKLGYDLAVDRNAFLFHGHPEKMKSFLGASMNTVPFNAAKIAIKNNIYFTRKNGLLAQLSLFYNWNLRKTFKNIA
jgi:GT2 family glycosyltransferase